MKKIPVPSRSRLAITKNVRRINNSFAESLMRLSLIILYGSSFTVWQNLMPLRDICFTAQNTRFRSLPIWFRPEYQPRFLHRADRTFPLENAYSGWEYLSAQLQLLNG